MLIGLTTFSPAERAVAALVLANPGATADRLKFPFHRWGIGTADGDASQKKVTSAQWMFREDIDHGVHVLC